MRVKKTFFFIDWDDTLFPTTAYKVNPTMNLCEVDKSITSFLTAITQYGGDIFIITNASLEWILRCMKVLPKTTDFFVKNDNTLVISARDMYSGICNENFWKVMCFRTVITRWTNNDGKYRLYVIGDSDHEYNATLNLKSMFPTQEHYFKRFKRFPTLAEIVAQIYNCEDSLKQYLV